MNIEEVQSQIKNFGRVARPGGLGRGQRKRIYNKSIGRVAEWLGRGLQNLVQQFKSARDLERVGNIQLFFYVFDFDAITDIFLL